MEFDELTAGDVVEINCRGTTTVGVVSEYRKADHLGITPERWDVYLDAKNWNHGTLIRDDDHGVRYGTYVAGMGFREVVSLEKLHTVPSDLEEVRAWATN